MLIINFLHKFDPNAQLVNLKDIEYKKKPQICSFFCIQ
mgnify:CR=1 FL=1